MPFFATHFLAFGAIRPPQHRFGSRQRSRTRSAKPGAPDKIRDRILGNIKSHFGPEAIGVRVFKPTGIEKPRTRDFAIPRDALEELAQTILTRQKQLLELLLRPVPKPKCPNFSPVLVGQNLFDEPITREVSSAKRTRLNYEYQVAQEKWEEAQRTARALSAGNDTYTVPLYGLDNGERSHQQVLYPTGPWSQELRPFHQRLAESLYADKPPETTPRGDEVKAPLEKRLDRFATLEANVPKISSRGLGNLANWVLGFSEVFLFDPNTSGGRQKPRRTPQDLVSILQAIQQESLV